MKNLAFSAPYPGLFLQLSNGARVSGFDGPGRRGESVAVTVELVHHGINRVDILVQILKGGQIRGLSEE